MKNKILFILAFLYVLTAFSQNDRLLIYGKISVDSLSQENIHIVNKNAKKGTVTNIHGEFQIPVKVSDTLLFSAIQFEYKELIISVKEIKEQKLLVSLKARINELDEVELKQHDLSGYLKSDIENASLKNHVDEFTLDLPNAGKAPITEVDFINRNINFYSKGGTITKLYGWISGEKKKLKNLRTLETEKMALNNIRKLITDAYFIETLSIKKEDISMFVEYCKPKGILKLYKENKKMEVIDILIEESKNFKRQ